VSLVAARSSSSFEVVDEVIREALTYPNLSVLVACRRYDLENDPRLRSLRDELRARVLEVGPLTSEQVSAVLEAEQIDSGRMSTQQLDLLRNPLNLRLLLEGGDVTTFSFRTRKDLFDRYWQEKRRRTSDRLGREAAWTEVVNRLTEEIDSRHVLSVPATVLDAWEHDAQAMVSEGVLVDDDGVVAFAHQAFFDYAFARRFVASGRDLVEFIRSSRQELFQRAQVREVLVHLRDVDFDRYLSAVADLLGLTDIRFHIRDAVLGVLEEVDNPEDAEWELVRDGLPRWGESVAARLRAIVSRKSAWFDRANAEGWLAAGLEHSDPMQVNITLDIVARAQRVQPAAAAQLLTPYIARDTEWAHRLSHVVSVADLTLDRSFLDFTVAAIKSGDLDDIQPFASNGSIWDEAYQLVRTRPEWAAEFARAYLDRRIALGGPGNEQATLEEIREPLDDEFFELMARGAPGEYLDSMLPWVLDVVVATTRASTNGEFDAFSARTRGQAYRLQDRLMAAFDIAFRQLGESRPEALDDWRVKLERVAGDTSNFLLVRLGTASPINHGIDIARLLAREPRRLEAGYWGSNHWATREFIESVSPHLPQDLSDELQEAILSYWPEWERTADGRGSRGRAQWELLSAFTPGSLNPQSESRLREVRHKFGDGPPVPPGGVEAGFIGSPIAEAAAPRLSDKQWLRAMSKYDSDTTRWDRPLDRAGGAHQLASTLFGQTVAEPIRFAGLATRLPDSVNSRYMDEILRGLAEATSPIPVTDVLAACKRAHALPGRPCGRGIVDAIAKCAHEELPPEALELVSWYATSSVDPSSPNRPVSGSDMSESDLMDTHAINSDRGRAVLAVAQLIRANPDRLDALRAAIHAAVRDPVDAVRAIAAEALLACVKHDLEFTENAFRELLTWSEDAILATRAVSRLASYFVQTNFDEYQDVLQRMLASSDNGVARVAGRLAILAQFASDDATPLAEAAMRGSDQQRLGAADVYAAILSNSSFAAACTAGLTTLFGDPASEVRREAATAFSTLPAESLGDHADLISRFIASPAFAENSSMLLRAIAVSPSVSARVELQACNRYLEIVGSAARDIRTRAGSSAGDVGRIVVRAHDHGDPETRQTALDVIDRLIEVGAFGVNDAIAAFER
jgi:hypothetical protein